MALNSGASAGAIRAGAAFVELFAKDDKLTKTLTGWKAKLLTFAKSSAGFGAAIAAPGVGILGTIGGVLSNVLERGDNIAKGATRIGASAEEYSALAYAAGQSGTSIEAVEKATMKLSVAANNGDKTFKKLGISAQNFKTLSRPEQFALIAEKLAGIENPSERSAIAMKLLGKGAAELAPLFAGGAEGIRSLIKEADRVGAVMTEEDARNAEQFGDALDRFGQSGLYAFHAVGAAMLPLVDDVERLTFLFVDFARAIKDFVDSNRRTVQIVAAVAAGLVVAGGALMFAGVMATAMVGILNLAIFAWGALAAALAFVLSPLGIFIITAGLAVYAIREFTDAGTESGKVLRETFDGLLHNATQAVQGIVDAISAGDLELAVQIAGAAMNVAWKSALLLFEKAWVGFKEFFVDGFYDALYLIEDGLIQLAGSFKSAFGEALRPIAQFVRDNKDLFAFLGLGGLATIKIADSLLDPASTEKQLAKLAAKYKELQDARDKARGDDVAGAQAALDAAEEELAALVAIAAVKRKEKEDSRKKPGPDLPDLQRQFGQSFGLFDAPNFKAAFARADSDAKRGADAAEGTEENTKGILDALKNLPIATFE